MVGIILIIISSVIVGGFLVFEVVGLVRDIRKRKAKQNQKHQQSTDNTDNNKK